MDNIFSDNPDDTITTPDLGEKDFLSELVGEGKKFKDPASLAKGKAEADAYIDILTKRMDDMRKELTSRQSVSELIDQIKKGQNPVEKPVDAPTTPPDVENRGFDEATLEAKINALLEQRTVKATTQSNLAAVTEELKTQFGSEATKVLRDTAKELGMQTGELETLAARSPAAFYRLTGITPGHRSEAGAPAIRSSIQTPDTSNVRNAKYYERLKATNPKVYFAAETGAQMMADAKKLGAKFYE